MTSPLRVLAVCVTGKTLWHVNKMLPGAIACFDRQNYFAKHLLLVTNTPTAQQIIGGRQTQLHCLPAWSLGRLRNAALEWAETSDSSPDLLIQWDDDDHYHPDRIGRQVAAYINSSSAGAVTLQRQIRYDMQTNTACLYDGGEVWGIHGTILHELDPKIRYPDLCRGEDTAFLRRWRERLVVLDNDPRLYIRFSHGRNTSGARHVMGRVLDHPNTWLLDKDCREYLKEVLEERKIPCRK